MATREQATLIDILEDRGLRLTRQRRTLLTILDEGNGHVNAQDLLRLGLERDRGINRATVYRTLKLLKQQGLVDELDLLHFEGEKHFYERRGSHDHVHIGCKACGTILEMETDLVSGLAAEVKRRTGFVPDSIRIEVRAVCAKCRGAAHSPVPEGDAGS